LGPPSASARALPSPAAIDWAHNGNVGSTEQSWSMPSPRGEQIGASGVPRHSLSRSWRDSGSRPPSLIGISLTWNWNTTFAKSPWMASPAYVGNG
jgi:hypothetical protein